MCDVCGNSPEWLSAPEKEAAAPVRRREPKKMETPLQHAAAERGKSAASGIESPDLALLDFFKQWRRAAAQRAQVPAYVVLSDAALVELCRKRPSNLRELLSVAGIGERKAELYGREIFAAFEAFENGARAAAREAAQASPAEETIRLLSEGKTFAEIAGLRGRSIQTVVNMVADLVEKGRVAYRVEWVGEENHRLISEAIAKLGPQWLKPLREALPEQIGYDQIRLVVAFARHNPATDAKC
jgi:ATP-dependent DNA helicase RecQ